MPAQFRVRKSAATSGGGLEIVRGIFSMELPKLTGKPEELCELRKTAQDNDIAAFWEMIEEQRKYAEANDEKYMARAEKIRDDFNQWMSDKFKLRATVPLVITGFAILYVVNPLLLPMGLIATAPYFGDLNKWWAQRQSSKGPAFEVVRTIKGRMNKL
jgi:hypothetical protein